MSKTSRFLVAGTVMFAEPNWELATANARFGIFLLNGPISPYIAAGAGWLREVSPDGDLPPKILTLEGLALLGEVGIAAFRDWRFGRLNGYLQVLQPCSDPRRTRTTCRPMRSFVCSRVSACCSDQWWGCRAPTSNRNFPTLSDVVVD